jgi:hypothetical protein
LRKSDCEREEEKSQRKKVLKCCNLIELSLGFLEHLVAN